MSIEHIPLLHIARGLHDLPRGMARFQGYLGALVDEEGKDVIAPLVAMNPMGREHVAARLDELLALGAESIAAAAAREAEARLPSFEGGSGRFRHGLVVADDVHGGWTHRHTTDAAARFQLENGLKRRWLATILWVSEAPSRERIREAVLATAARADHFQRHGAPRTLRERMAQEGRAAHFAGAAPRLPPDDIDYSRHVLAPHLDTAKYPVCFAALYGDEAARALGYAPLGLSPCAGFEVALADASEPRS